MEVWNSLGWGIFECSQPFCGNSILDLARRSCPFLAAPWYSRKCSETSFRPDLITAGNMFRSGDQIVPEISRDTQLLNEISAKGNAETEFCLFSQKTRELWTVSRELTSPTRNHKRAMGVFPLWVSLPLVQRENLDQKIHVAQTFW